MHCSWHRQGVQGQHTVIVGLPVARCREPTVRLHCHLARLNRMRSDVRFRGKVDINRTCSNVRLRPKADVRSEATEDHLVGRFKRSSLAIMREGRPAT
jgi:hypothetical protein